MDNLLQQKIEARTQLLGHQIFEQSRLNPLGKGFWISKIMELATGNARVKTQLFRFVDVLPVLKTPAQRKDHLIEYLQAPSSKTKWPMILRVATAMMRVPFINRGVVSLSDFQVRQMANHFIVGETLDEALPKITARREHGLAFTLDILGEAVVAEDEAQHYYDRYLELIEGLGARSLKEHPILDRSSLGSIPPVNISVKISALDCRVDSVAYQTSLDRLEQKLVPLMATAQKNGVFINFDMEQFALKELFRDLFKRLISRPEFKSYRHWGIVVQAYLRSAEEDVRDWIQFAKERGTPFTIRLVKGAYWDYEKIVADQNGWECPVFLKKSESDASFENCARLLLEAYPHIELAVGSHNIRSIAYCLATAEALGLASNALEIQMLFGMAEPFKQALVKMGYRVREYDPVGKMLPGLSYLVRRLLENTSNDSFLKQTFMDKTGIHHLLRRPL